MFAIVGVLIAIFLSRFVIYPINKLIESAEKITEEDKKDTTTIKSKKTNKKGNLETVFGMMTTELKEKLSEVSTQKNQIETILLHMTEGIIAFNREGEIILINPAAKKFLSIRPEDNTFDDIFKKFKLDINMEKVIYLENWTSTQQRIQVKDRYVNVYFAPFKNEDDRPDGVIAVIQDITQYVKLDNMQKEFVADVSHELKTPIALIQGYSEGLLENVNSDEESRKFYAEVILDETNKMDKLVKQLLELMKLEYGKREFQDTKFNIVELEKEVVRKSKVMLEEKQVDVKIKSSDEIVVLADDFYIEQVISNYITNAIKHVVKVDGIKEIVVENVVDIEKNKVRVKVFNTGYPIKEEDIARIWNRFFKVDESRNRAKGGTGIGLSFVKAIMSNYGNSYGVINKDNGVEFYFELDMVI